MRKTAHCGKEECTVLEDRWIRPDSFWVTEITRILPKIIEPLIIRARAMVTNRVLMLEE